MKIKLTNKTAYRDDDVRALVRGACAAAGTQVRVLHLMVSYARRNAVSGNAYVPGPGRRKHFSNTMRLRIPKPGVAIRQGSVAQVALHEAMHVAGAQHQDMTAEQWDCTMPVPWAEHLQLRVKEAPDKPDPELRKAALRSDRLEHAQVMLAKAETRAKRADTILKKWKRRVGALSR